MSYAVLLAPHFSLEALRCGAPELAGQPVALIAGEGRKAVITEVSPEAPMVEAGCAATLAMARCPGIVLRTRDFAAEAEAQRLLVAAGFTLSPRVETTGPGCCTVDLQGADLARSESEIRLRIAELAPLGLTLRAGIGATPLLASYAAHQTDSLLRVDDARAFLRTLPLEVGGPSADELAILRNWGLQTLGDLTALTKADVGQRLGARGVALWERAAGETTRVLRLVEPSRSFVAEWAYEPPIEMLEPLTFKLQRFAERVALELRAAGFVAEALTLYLLLEDGSDHRREFHLPEPGADVASWMRVLLSHLETLRLTSHVIGARLLAAPARPQQKQDGLFDTGLRDPVAFWENLARLGALVGPDRVGTPVVAETHRADAFTLAKPADVVPAATEPPIHPERGLVLRRFRPAWPAAVGLREGKPQALGGAVSGPIVATAGPWRCEGGWWHRDAWCVETWHVEVGDGAVYQLARTGETWCIEGVLD
ncbi:MAG: Nucleotidyltransferase/DNA polymerase involved in repair-like protein [Verrucomicrobia bacterium]|nr:Nucleotidyltransferase/DNA polymerase involved in repair-like protein [Verrucomicrobiota bacterium]